MNFILSDNGQDAINSKSIKKLFVRRFKSSKIVYVTAECYGNPDEVTEFIIKEFNSNDADENFRAAKKYLADLIAELNADNAE